jgi:hypothetical protein
MEDELGFLVENVLTKALADSGGGGLADIDVTHVSTAVARSCAVNVS